MTYRSEIDYLSPDNLWVFQRAIEKTFDGDEVTKQCEAILEALKCDICLGEDIPCMCGPDRTLKGLVAHLRLQLSEARSALNKELEKQNPQP